MGHPFRGGPSRREPAETRGEDDPDTPGTPVAGQNVRVTHTEGMHTARDGAILFWQEWLPEGDPRAVVVLIHGLGEHSGRYSHLAERFVAENIAVLTQDNRGHGKTPGGRGVLDFDKAVDDVGELLDEARSRFPGIPLVLYGHSLGALMSMVYSVRQRPRIAAQVASAPALDSELREQKVKLTAVNLLGGVLPNVVIPTGLDSKGVSRDPAVVAAYESDPLVHDKGSLGLAKGTFSAMDVMMAQTEFPVPLLIVHGTGDRLTVPAASTRFVEQVSGDVTLIEYDGMFHEPHNEPEQAEVFADIMAWLDKHLPN
jgi:alpha-beta hydrolase superfamily lysophospholipase